MAHLVDAESAGGKGLESIAAISHSIALRRNLLRCKRMAEFSIGSFEDAESGRHFDTEYWQASKETKGQSSLNAYPQIYSSKAYGRCSQHHIRIWPDGTNEVSAQSVGARQRLSNVQAALVFSVPEGTRRRRRPSQHLIGGDAAFPIDRDLALNLFLYSMMLRILKGRHFDSTLAS